MKLTWETFTIQAKHPFRDQPLRTGKRRARVGAGGGGRPGRLGRSGPFTLLRGNGGDGDLGPGDGCVPVIEGAADPENLEILERDLENRHWPQRVCAGRRECRPARPRRENVRGLPLWKLWGLDPAEAPPSSFTIGLDEPAGPAEEGRGSRGLPHPQGQTRLGPGRRGAIHDLR